MKRLEHTFFVVVPSDFVPFVGAYGGFRGSAVRGFPCSLDLGGGSANGGERCESVWRALVVVVLATISAAEVERAVLVTVEVGSAAGADEGEIGVVGCDAQLCG